jgi:hypothetical protein
VSIGLGYWDQNPGIHTRPDIPLTAIPLNRKRNGITDPGSGMQNRPCAANVWSPRPRVGHHISRPPTCPNGGLLSIAATSDGTTRSVNANSAAQPRSSIVFLSDTSQTTSGCFHSVPELTPSSIAACESQVNNEMLLSDIPGTVSIR